MKQTAPSKRPWLLIVDPVADLDKGDSNLERIREMHEQAVACLSKGFKQADSHIARYYSASWPETSGGVWHLLRQSENFTRLGKKMYMDLVLGRHSISEIRIIATESGAYLIRQVLQFIAVYGDKFCHGLEELELHPRWIDFIFFDKLEVDQVPKEDELLGLVRSMVLIHPSLPPPSGLVRLFWPWTEPGPYKYRNKPSIITATFKPHILVIWHSGITRTPYKVAISDSYTVKHVEDLQGLRTVIHEHIVAELLTNERVICNEPRGDFLEPGPPTAIPGTQAPDGKSSHNPAQPSPQPGGSEVVDESDSSPIGAIPGQATSVHGKLWSLKW